jgi:CDP-glycerol glycerophosphotransferase (TagB/SpsB family)
VLFSACTKPITPAAHARAIQIFHGLSFRNRSVRARNLDYDHCFAVGPYMMRRFGELAADAGEEQLIPVGFPKTDRLLDGSLDRHAIQRSLGFDGTRPVLLYAPTGAHDNSLETLGEELLMRLSGQDRYDVLVKPHDHPKKPIDWFARLAPLEGEHLRVAREPDVIPLMLASDLLISDASSVATEYTLLDRPIVFLDVPELLAAAAADDDRLDLATWGRRGGRVAGSCDEALQAIADELAAPDEALGDVRRALRDDCFYNPGAATAAAMGWMGEHVLR